jgi:Protein of unknown function (DUF1441)
VVEVLEDIEHLDGKIRLSIARLAAEFGMARETVAKRLAIAQVPPDGKRNGHPTYRLRDAADALLATWSETDRDGLDTSRLRPMERRAWFQSENERLKFEQETGKLLLNSEVQFEMAALAKIVVRFLETLPDVAERDLRCGPDVVEYLTRKIREMRADIANAVLTEDADEEQAVDA